MYHDQALIPIKTIAFDEGVNVTLGLPFVRTSPDHGTAFDIAGKGVARPDSLDRGAAPCRRASRRGRPKRAAMSPIDSLPPLREVVRAHGLLPKKSLGQNFLFDLNLTSRIARAAGPLEDVTVRRGRPGPGRPHPRPPRRRRQRGDRDRARPALPAGARRDRGALSRAGFEVVEADALGFDPRPLLGGGPARIVANLPYNVGTALLTGWLTAEAWPPWWRSLTLMFQREVAERIVADERDRANYGRLGVLAGWRTQARILFDVPPAAFVPPPKVTSSVVLLTPRPDPLPCRVEALEAVTRAAFGQRRKMLRQSLKSLDAGSRRTPRRGRASPRPRAPRRCRSPAMCGWRMRSTAPERRLLRNEFGAASRRVLRWVPGRIRLRCMRPGKRWRDECESSATPFPEAWNAAKRSGRLSGTQRKKLRRSGAEPTFAEVSERDEGQG